MGDDARLPTLATPDAELAEARFFLSGWTLTRYAERYRREQRATTTTTTTTTTPAERFERSTREGDGVGVDVLDAHSRGAARSIAIVHVHARMPVLHPLSSVHREERRGHEAEPAFRRGIRQRCVGRRVAPLVEAARLAAEAAAREAAEKLEAEAAAAEKAAEKATCSHRTHSVE